MGEVWRTGRRQPRTLYRQLGLEPSEDDPMIGAMDTPELAAEVVAVVNGLRREPHPTDGVPGPYDTEREANAEPMPQEVATLHDQDRVRSGEPDNLVRDTMLRHLIGACRDSGVVLGAYDLRMLGWLCGLEPSTVQVVIGLVTRAYEAGREASR